jgi:thiamine transport system permease protein
MRARGAAIPYLAPVVGFVALFVLLPVADLFFASLSSAGGLAGTARLLSDSVTVRSVDNSLVQGGLSAALAVAVGYPAGVFLGRYTWTGQGAVRSVLLVPFLLPSLVVVLGVLDLFGPTGLLASGPLGLSFFGRGIPAIVGANLLFNAPIVVLLTAAGCEVAPAALEETVATLGGSPGRAYLETWAGPTARGAVAGGLLTFLFSALSFAPPLLLCGSRCYTVEARIWELDQTLLEPAAAGVLALAMVLLFLAPTAVYLYLVARLRATPGRPAARRRPVPWRSVVGPSLAAVTVLLLAAEVALLGAVLYRGIVPPGGGTPGREWVALFSASTTSRLGISIVGALGNTLFFASAAAAIALVLGILAGFAVVRRPVRAAALGLLLFVPLLVSPIVLAFGLANFWRPILGGLSTVWFLVIVSQATLALPFALQSVELPLAALPPAAADAARTLGATRWGAFLDADLPRAKSGLVTACLFAFALGLGEFTATFFLVTPRFTTLPVALYGLQNSRQFPVADAAAGLLLLLSLAVFAALSLGGRRVEL